MTPRYRLGLDLGSNSIGFCALLTNSRGEPTGILDMGVRILSPNEEAGRDPQSKQSLAADRRAARSMRRRRDRFLRRQKLLMTTLIKAGLMPQDETARKDLERLDPYWLRAAALTERLDPHEIGRAIFHLNQRRGFLSNRIADSENTEDGETKKGMARLAEALEANGARTLGAFLAQKNARDREGYLVDKLDRRIGRRHGNQTEHPTDNAVRFRPYSEGSKVLYDLYPTRAMIEQELDEIWRAQSQYHEALTGDLLARLKRIIIEQRPLKKPLVGKCTFRPEEERAPRALPLFQRFRILMETANLEIERPGRPARRLSLQERDSLVSVLSGQASTVTFDKMRTALKLPAGTAFNLEVGKRKGLDPDKTAAILAKTGKGECFGKAWRGLARARQNEIVERLLTEQNPDALVAWLMDECGLSEDRARAASAARLPQGHAHVGRSILAELVDVMETECPVDPKTGELHDRPLTYDEAIAALGLHHSDFEAGRHARLPYYGEAMARHVIANPGAPEGSQERIGRVPNPTVHIALNQMRAVVNTLIDAYGPPAEIVIELARELKMNKDQKAEATRRNRQNEAENEEIRKELAEIDLADTYGNRLMMRLYRELPADERVCVYSGVPISKEMIQNSEVDVDHILPRSKTLDDSFMNKVLCTREANRRKGNRAPAQAWDADELQEIHERAKRIVPKKAWRFAPDAMERFARDGDFLARQLTDSQHMARLTKAYLGHLYGEEANRRVWATPGRLTAMLRRHWGLNALLRDHNRWGDEEDSSAAKNRDDHTHHALDAFIVAYTSRGLLQRIQTAAGQAEKLDLDRWAEKGHFPEPFEGYKDTLRAQLDKLVISHKPDHGISPANRNSVHVTSGQLHEETAYGVVDEVIGDKHYNLVTRKPIEALTAREIGQVRDARLREALQEVEYEAKRDGEKLEVALRRFGETHKIRRVRVLKTEKYTSVIRHGAGRYEKAYVPGSNHRIEIYATQDGKWHGEGISVFNANRPDFEPDWPRLHPEAALIMRLHKGDLFEADFGAGPEIFVVRKLSPANNRIEFLPHWRGGKIESKDYLQAAFSKLRKAGARRVRVDPIGRVSYVERT